MSITVLSPTSILSDLAITKYVSAAASTVYFYDLVLSWDDEVALFWNGKGGPLIRVLFLMNRYLPIIPCSLTGLNWFSSSQTGCRFFLILDSSCQVIGISVSTAIFCLRACTIYQYVPTVQYILIGSYWISVLSLLVLSTVTVTLMMDISPSSGSCILGRSIGPGFTTAGMAFLAPLLCEIVVIMATMKHAFNTRQIRRELHISAASPALRRLYHDGFVHFIVVFSLRLLSCLEWYLCPKSLRIVTLSLEYSLTSILTSRFFFALRRSLVISPNTAYSVDEFDYIGPTIDFEPSIGQMTSSIVEPC